MKKSINAIFVSLLMSIVLVNCGGNGSSAPTELNSYNGAGSQWDVTLSSDNTFVITHKPNALTATAIDMTINGTYADLSSGFKKLTVTEVSGTYADKPVVGDIATALEVESYAFFLHPSGSSGEVITMVKSGSCPTADFSGNWITARNLHNVHPTTGGGASADASDPTQDAFGAFSWDNTTSTITLTSKYSLQAPTTPFALQPGNAITCSNGVATLSGGETTVFLTTNGGAISHGDYLNGGGLRDENIITVFQAEDIPSKTSFDGDYAGLLTLSDIDNSDSVKPITMTCNNGVCTGKAIDVDTGLTIAADPVATITLSGALNTPSNGFINGTVAIAGVGNGKITCMIDTNAASTSKNIISCSGQDPSDNTKLFNILLVTE